METQALRISRFKADGAGGVATLGLITWRALSVRGQVCF